MEQIIKDLYPMNRCLLGEGFDNALLYINHLIPLETIEIKSGTKLGTWTVPDEWIVKDAWVKNPAGEKILNYKVQPLSLMVGSDSCHGMVDLNELKGHLTYNEDMPDATPYKTNYYGSDWGFCIPYNQMRERTGEIDEQGLAIIKDKLPEGSYEVMVDTEHRPGTMKIGVHTISGGSSREILIFAHLDHPFQANDNLSGVACVIDMVGKLKTEHTVKLIFCPETIGSIGYALTQDISKVDLVIALDICGNDNSILFQKSFDYENNVNRMAHLALHSFAETYRKGEFRNTIGSDEYAFNDPAFKIPGIMFSTHPYKEYHTSEDTPDKINYSVIERVQKAVLKTIDIYEKDFIPKKEFLGPLARSKYGIQTTNPQFNLSIDYLFYLMDGKRSLAELCAELGLAFDQIYELILRMETNGEVSRVDSSKEGKQKVTKQKRSKLSGSTDVSSKRRKVS